MLPVKKQCTSFPCSERESEIDNGGVGKHKQKKKKKKKKANSKPIKVTNSEVEETEEEQEKCQWAKKWKQELEQLQLYQESHNIFLNALPSQNGGSHMGYLESHIQDTGTGYFFMWSFEDWKMDLQKQSQGLGHSTTTWLNTWLRYLSIPVPGTTFC